jgi:hypothetical protein
VRWRGGAAWKEAITGSLRQTRHKQCIDDVQHTNPVTQAKKAMMRQMRSMRCFERNLLGLTTSAGQLPCRA